MLVTEGKAPFRDYEAYRVTGDLGSGLTPLIVAHGGPGCTHDYVESFAALAGAGRAVIHYDQIGNGRSTRLPEEGAGFWTVDLFMANTQPDRPSGTEAGAITFWASPGAGCWGRNSPSPGPADEGAGAGGQPRLDAALDRRDGPPARCPARRGEGGAVAPRGRGRRRPPGYVAATRDPMPATSAGWTRRPKPSGAPMRRWKWIRMSTT